jgi:ATP-dependent DNA helicase PIF1
VDEGLCNGSQGIVVDILENQTITDDFYGVFTEKINLPLVKFSNGHTIRITPRFWQSDDYPRIIVGQFPLIHAWALTFHKAQGATLERGEVDAGSSVFEYGQSYVGLSRIRSLEGLYLTNFHPKRIKAHPVVKEFYRSIRDIIPESETIEAEIIEDSHPIAVAVNNVIDMPMAEATIVERFNKFNYIVEKLP